MGCCLLWDFLQLHVNRMSILSFQKRPHSRLQEWLVLFSSTQCWLLENIYLKKWLYILVFVHFLPQNCFFFSFNFVFALYFVSLVCDMVKWFLAFVRLRNVECRVAFTASRGHRLLARFWSWGRNQCDDVYFAVLARQQFRETSAMFIVYMQQQHEHSGWMLSHTLYFAPPLTCKYE